VERNNLYKIKTHYQIYSLLSTTIADVDAVDDPETNESSRTEFDSHANMPVVGRHAYIISDTGKIADVSPFTPDYKSMEIPIVDAAVQYEDPYDGKEYILVIRNALYVPSMKNNLLPPFILRQAGIEVNDVPKIHTNEPTQSTHSVTFKETNFTIPLSLWGTFSYFPTSKPTADGMQASDEIYMLTPSTFNPHDDSYAMNEASMLDWQGHMVEPKHRTTILLSDVPDNEVMSMAGRVSSIESNAVDRDIRLNYENDDEKPVEPQFKPVPRATDEVSSVLAGISPIYNDAILYQRLTARSDLGKFQASVGSTYAPDEKYLVSDDDTNETDPETEYSDSNDSTEEMDGYDQLLDEIYNSSIRGEIDLDDIMVKAAHAKRHQGSDVKHLSKVWKISTEEAERTLDVTTEHSKRSDDPKLSHNYGTNDRMLRYKRIHEYFFMDTFFATKKGKKSSRGHTCCQLFVSDKGFVFVVPMKAKNGTDILLFLS
jgi:hypothetical protein